MEMTSERRQALYAYCKVSELAGDPEVYATMEALYAAAVGYMAGAGISEPDADSPRRAQYDLAVNALVLDGWDHRELTIEGTTATENPALRRIINQLKFSESA
jgi:hypothetical protein